MAEITPRYGRVAYLPDLGGGARGVIFEPTAEGLKLYVAVSPHGIYAQDGYEANPRDGVDYAQVHTPGCSIHGIALAGPQELIGSCWAEKSLVRIDLVTQEIEQLYAAPASTNGEVTFEPRAVAYDGQSTVLTGMNEIYAIDIGSGESLGVVVPNGFHGATQFRDMVYGPDGHLYVSANPNIGILVLNRNDYSLHRILAPGGIADTPNLGPLAFSEDGKLFAMSGETTRDGIKLVEIDTIKGSVVRTVFEDSEGCCTPGVFTAFLAIRP